MAAAPRQRVFCLFVFLLAPTSMLPLVALSLSLLAPVRLGAPATIAPLAHGRCVAPACCALERAPRLGHKIARSAKAAAPVAALALGAIAAAPTAALAAASTAAATEHLHLGQKIALFFQKTGLPNWAVLMLISAVPAVELRGGVPVGNWMGLSPWATFAICVVGNMVPLVPFFLALRSAVVKVRKRLPYFS